MFLFLHHTVQLLITEDDEKDLTSNAVPSFTKQSVYTSLVRRAVIAASAFDAEVNTRSVTTTAEMSPSAVMATLLPNKLSSTNQQHPYHSVDGYTIKGMGSGIRLSLGAAVCLVAYKKQQQQELTCDLRKKAVTAVDGSSDDSALASSPAVARIQAGALKENIHHNAQYVYITFSFVNGRSSAVFSVHSRGGLTGKGIVRRLLYISGATSAPTAFLWLSFT